MERVFWHSRCLTPVFSTRFVDSVPHFCVKRSWAFFFYKEGEQLGSTLGEMVVTIFGFSICFICIPAFFDTLNTSCRQSWLVWPTHKCLLRPLHLCLVLSICLVHCLLNLCSIGNLTKSLHTYENCCIQLPHNALPCSDTQNCAPFCVTLCHALKWK